MLCKIAKPALSGGLCRCPSMRTESKCIKAWACLVQDGVVADRALKAEVERLPRALQTVWYHETRRKEAKRQTDDAGADGSGDEEATSSTAGPRLSYNRASSCSSAACDSAWAC